MSKFERKSVEKKNRHGIYIVQSRETVTLNKTDRSFTNKINFKTIVGE